MYKNNFLYETVILYNRDVQLSPYLSYHPFISTHILSHWGKKKPHTILYYNINIYHGLWNSTSTSDTQEYLAVNLAVVLET